MKTVSIIGLGYIGLPTAILAIEGGYTVFGYDIDQEKIASIQAGKSPIIEPEVEERLNNALKTNRFQVSTELAFADCFVITVPTPFKQNNKADLSYVYQALDEIAQKLMPGNLVIIESTIPVGTTERVGHYLEEASNLTLGKDFFLSHCPERALPGKLFEELSNNDRILGGVCQTSSNLSYNFYKKFVSGSLFSTSDKAAEMVKLIENSSRDVQIAFANQVGGMCKEAGIDPYHVIELANRHPRVNILSPTCGVGGHCIAIDPWFLVEKFPKHTQLLKAARLINDAKPSQVIEQVIESVEQFTLLEGRKPKILGLGLSFKPNVDDLRESPALAISTALAQISTLQFVSHDPYIDKKKIPEVILFDSNLNKILKEADIVLVLVKHKEFTKLPLESFCNKITLDSCGLIYEITKKEMQARLSKRKEVDCNFENVSL